ncbi:hypothetical protein OBBRIDRAFT_800895 [Obba rivulosa]|uniref:Uncharacterized protein n=1 Tax=Obba rivulosa TaxID=1052685 RepID=A0A8E2DS89_9APHY|nr:hypothetical protein OBBRIDRAFT_800895 [Obba rivulosa]
MSEVEATRVNVPDGSQRLFHEVIDVDLINDEGLPNPRPLRRRRLSPGARNNETASTSRASDSAIIILDSDDETAATSTSRGASGRTSRLISPPPPPIQRAIVPPVPPLPGRFSRHGPHFGYRHRGHPPATPPVIRPNDQPFPFEADLRAPSPRPRSPPVGVPLPRAGAAHSHHQPVMGFGGAMIALNRQNAIEEANRERRQAEAQVNGGMFADLMRRIRSSSSSLARIPGRWLWYHDQDYLPVDELHVPEAVDDMWENFFLPVGWSPFGTGHHGPRAGPQAGSSEPAFWKPSYTHPEKAPPGFTFDFSPAETTSGASSPRTVIVIDDENGVTTTTSEAASSTAVDMFTTLICARCLEPLVLGAGNGSEQEQKKRRVWALRCGHMLDGRCVDELMRPPEPILTASNDLPAAIDYDSKGKGKAVAIPEADLTANAIEPTFTKGKGKSKARTPSSPRDRKGKGKAVAPPEGDVSPQTTQDSAQDHIGLPNSQAEYAGNSMRSRLRPRASRGSSILASPLAHHGLALSPTSPVRPMRPVPRRAMSSTVLPRGRGRGKAKGKGRERKPVIEAEHEWRCPVAGCGHPHLSLKVDGEWKMDESRGAVAVFV